MNPFIKHSSHYNLRSNTCRISHCNRCYWFKNFFAHLSFSFRFIFMFYFVFLLFMNKFYNILSVFSTFFCRFGILYRLYIFILCSLYSFSLICLSFTFVFSFVFYLTFNISRTQDFLLQTKTANFYLSLKFSSQTAIVK